MGWRAQEFPSRAHAIAAGRRMAVQPMARDWSLMQRQGPPFPVVPAPPPEVGRPPDDIGTGHCSWYPTCAFDQVLPVTADDVCIRWSQFEGTGVALQYAINRCDAPFFAGGAWGSTSSFGGDAYDSGGTLIMPGVISSKYPYEYVRLKLRMSQLGGPVEFELVGQGFGYYGGGDVTANRTMVGLFGVTFSHVIEQITNGDGYMRIKADPVAMTMRVRMWR